MLLVRLRIIICKNKNEIYILDDCFFIIVGVYSNLWIEWVNI